MVFPDRLIEREEVLGWLEGRLNDAKAGVGHVAVVSGEAGIGKSAVVDAFVASVPMGTSVFSGACDPLATPVPLGPVLELRDTLAPETATRLTEALDNPQGLAAVPAAVVAALVDSSPSVWVIDDVQWADAATLNVLRYLTNRVVGIPVLLVLTHRIEDLGSAHPLTGFLSDIADVEVLSGAELAPLTRDGVTTLAAYRPGVDIDLLFETTGGIPLFVVESLTAGGYDVVPRNVSDHVIGRLSRLTAEVRAVIDAVAVLGPDATVDVLADMVADAQAALNAGVTARVLQHRGQVVAFRHELTRQAVLEAIPVLERRTLHASVLTALTSEARECALAHLAFHAEEAGDDDAVLRYAPQAAERAMLLGAFTEATEQYARVVRHSPGQPAAVRASWLESQARAAYLSGQVAAAAETITRAIALRREVGDLLREGDDHRWLSHYRLFAGAPLAQVSDSAETAVRILEPLGPTTELVGAYANAVQLGFAGCDRDGAVDYVDKAAAIGEHLDAIAEVTWARLFAALSAVLAGEGWSAFDDTWASACADPWAVEAAAVGGVVACWLATASYDLDRADRYLTETAAFCHDHHLTGFGSFTQGISTTLLLHRGRYAEASAAAQAVLAESGLPSMFRLRPLVTLALVHARTGDHDTVWPMLDEALTGHDASVFWLTGTVLAARIEAAWLAGDQDRAQAEARQALAALPAGVDVSTGGQITAWAAIAGVFAAPPPRHSDHPQYELQVDLQWDAAAAEWRRRGCPYEGAVAAMHSSTSGVAADAVDELQSLGVNATVERARDLRRRRHQRRSTQRNPFGLTNREQQVARLLADRHTDKEIADMLVISQRTASHHVASVLAKLGVRNRRAVRGMIRLNRETNSPRAIQ
jgi:DNA-binding CsgD family transcriptional regulator/tetratricopeptide (TPR) repeat protein